MNQQLKNIQNFIQQNQQLSEQEKEALLKSVKDADKEFSIIEFKLDRTEKVKRTTAILLEETIEELEQKRKAIEEKNQELEIENALEKVRAIALSMNEPADMPEVCKIIATELDKLGIKEIRNVQTAIFYESKGTYMNYEFYAKHNKTIITEVSYTNHAMHLAFADQMLKGKGEFFSTYMSKAELPDWIAYQKTTNVFIDTYIETASSLNYYWYSLGPVALGISTYVPLTKEEINLFKRFLKVFELAYTRYLDIEQALAQAREAQIEATLERVRSRSLAMQKSEELKDVIQIVHDQFIHLNIYVEHAGFIMDYKERDDMHIWLADKHAVPSEITFPYFDSPHWNSFVEAKEKGLDFFSNHLSFEEKNKFYNDLFKLFPVPDDAREYYFNCPGLAISTVLLENVGLYIENFSGTPYTDEENKTLMRFGKVFQQTHTRFLDLQKAEAQARESQIQLALERVRARTMAMHQSTELADTSSVLFQQIKDLGFETWSCGFCIWSKDDFAEVWMGADSGGLLPPMMIPYKEEPTHHDIYQASLRGDAVHEKIWEGKALENHYDFLRTIPSVAIAIKQLEDAGLSLPAKQCYYVGFFKQGYLLLITKEPNAEMYGLTKRFANVFEQTYTRFLDLQKAEAQSRESQIQLALERLRARTMAMQHSNELLDAATLLFQQIKSLGTSAWNCSFNIWIEDKKQAIAWNATKEGFGRPFNSPSNQDVFQRFYEASLKGEELYVEAISGDALKHHYDYLSTLPGIGETLAELKAAGVALPTFQIFNIAYFTKGYLMFITYEPVPELWDIFKRFAKVFEQTYTRFLDLQKAEAQSRESQIETALERVRAMAMSMMKSEELSAICEVVFKQLQLLGFADVRAAQIYIRNDAEEKFLNYDYSDITGADVVEVGYNSHPHTKRIYDVIKNAGDALIDNKITKDELDAWKFYLYNTLKQPPEKSLDAATELHYYLYSIGTGAFGICTFKTMSQEELMGLKRFRNVFSLSYQRYTDITIAEAQTREAKIEAALERVRSRTLAMQKSDELAETSAVLFQQLIALGIAPNRLYIGVINDDSRNIEFWITDEDGSKVSAMFKGNAYENISMKKMYDGWKQQKKYLVIDMQGKELADYFHYLGDELNVPFKDGLLQKRRVQYVAYFNKGFIGMASPDKQPDETVILLERFTAVFNLTFTRFNDLKVAEAHATQAEEDLIKLQAEKRRAEDALTELKETQKQLIQSEKMASLGELTAGIAHEIQNPLNFVNNFSEVSKELLDEMKAALENGDDNDAKEIADDVIKNLEKINHHGKRADAIVKGMLQHSRASTSQKELTDINKLTDEYIRLCYHGLRVKDNTFNATIITDFDNSIEKINIIPQDIGRVILNILTNAFYAVNEPSNSLKGEQYKPLVTVTTKAVKSPSGDLGVLLTVSDNGNGIPQNIVDKIFQPFFTTKPTGRGTGLGLSLSYDIVKAHGGELKVNTKENEGTEFIIQLPTI